MRVLVLSCLLAASLAAPAAQPEKDDDNLAVEAGPGVVHVVGAPVGYEAKVITGTSVADRRQAVAYATPVLSNTGTPVFAGFAPSVSTYAASVPVLHKFREIDDDDVKVISHGYNAVANIPSGVNVVVSSPVATEHTGQIKVETPVVTAYHATNNVAYKVGQAGAVPAAATYHQVGHSISTPAVASYAVATPVQYKAAAVDVAPAVATVQHQAVVHEVKPVSVAVPTTYTFESAQTVELAPKEVHVPVHHQTVHVPVEKRVQYGTKNFVVGSTTTVHKPQLSAPAISAPNVLVAKTNLAAPEVTVHQSEVTVEKKSPNYVAAPYDAGVIVEKANPEFKQIDVPTPVEVPQPIPVPTPYAVPVAQPVKVKSSINPVVHTDVHTVRTENVVTPIEYSAHHHVAASPVVASAPAVQTSAVQGAPVALSYGAPTATGIAQAVALQGVPSQSFAVQGVPSHGYAIQGVPSQSFAVQGVPNQGFAVQGVSSQGFVSGGQAIGYSGFPAGYNAVVAASPTYVAGGYQKIDAIPSTAFTGQKVGEAVFQSAVIGDVQTGAANKVITYTAGAGTVGQQVVQGNPTLHFVAAPAAQVTLSGHVEKKN
ncbi:hypothetical protein HAZT_HAZT001349 [Hyalella azteca]|uniref:Uncharacterized protein LOC108675836 n=1 Tax=Hyalella azteca TaxID=294128 RepID=A0A6A0H348_HYAAZ|nr:uncharacterized protein LOC108675836 [Hyalella azteca]KAA0197158.1 hypothetical protein HAZT_HAZT001349 [Hyalella azteca]